ncbi:MAG: hypothetical protein K8S98_11240 [Planctomycetes bacterium]|nr:hypothetical protein [Planctomycetota bacterium]
MSLSTQVTLVGCVAAVALGLFVGGPVGVGIVAGFAAGAGVALGLGGIQKRIVVAKPIYVVHVVAGGFLAKICALLAAAAAVRFIAPLADAVEWRAFTVAFAAAVLVLLPCTTFELMRLVQARALTNRANQVAFQRGTLS